MRKPLSSFGKNELETLMTDMGSKPRIFNSEAQFQFELAWKIKERFDCDVKLEELSRTSESVNANGKKVVKKDYTDIILEKDNYRIAIELKYKTVVPININITGNILLMNHGATDLGAYDYMWDIHRIQVLTGNEPDDDSDVRMSCTRGYAVMLTNDPRYWKTNPNNNPPTKGINREFLIGEGLDNNAFFKQGEHQWYTTQGEKGLSKALLNDKSRQTPISFSQDYPYQWKEYCSPIADKNGVFRFMIVEIDSTMEAKTDLIKDNVVIKLAERIDKKYGFRWFKCVDLAMLASWYQKTYTMEELAMLDIEELFKQVCNEIDNDEIM